MRCPYCAEMVHDDAIVCPHCHRDFSPMKPMMRQVEALAARVDALEQARPAAPAAGMQAMPAASPAAAIPAGPSYSLVPPLVAIALLVGMHYAIIIKLDLPLLALRIVSILIPFVAGFMFRRTVGHALWFDFVTGLGVAFIAMLAMLFVVSRVDSVPILPIDVIGWREFVDYMVSITLGFFAGALMRQCVMLAREPDAEGRGLLGALTHALLRDVMGTQDRKSLESQLKSVEAIITSGFAVMVAIGSIIAGIGRLLH